MRAHLGFAIFSCLIIPAGTRAQQSFVEDFGKIKLEFSLNDQGFPFYEMSFKNRTVIKRSVIA